MSTGTNWRAAAQLGHDSKTVFAGQHHVQDDEIECRRVTSRAVVRARLAVIDDLGGVAFGLEVEPQAVGKVLLVFDDEDALHRASGARRARQLQREGAAVARPSLSANPFPPCCVATERTMKSPSPVPLARIATLAGMR